MAAHLCSHERYQKCVDLNPEKRKEINSPQHLCGCELSSAGLTTEVMSSISDR